MIPNWFMNKLLKIHFFSTWTSCISNKIHFRTHAYWLKLRVSLYRWITLYDISSKLLWVLHFILRLLFLCSLLLFWIIYWTFDIFCSTSHAMYTYLYIQGESFTCTNMSFNRKFLDQRKPFSFNFFGLNE